MLLSLKMNNRILISVKHDVKVQRESMRKIIGCCGFIGFVVIFLVIHFYPEIPRSILAWVALLMLGIPAWIFLEWLGDITLSSSFFKNRSRSIRIMLGVPTVILLGGIALIVISFVRHFINYAGG